MPTGAMVAFALAAGAQLLAARGRKRARRPALVACGAVKEVVDAMISESPVLIVSKASCGCCRSAKAALDSLGASYKVLELEAVAEEQPDVEDPRAVQDYMEELTGARSVPRVFIGGKFVGGADDTIAKRDSGELLRLLEGVGGLTGATGTTEKDSEPTRYWTQRLRQVLRAHIERDESRASELSREERDVVFRQGPGAEGAEEAELEVLTRLLRGFLNTEENGRYVSEDTELNADLFNACAEAPFELDDLTVAAAEAAARTAKVRVGDPIPAVSLDLGFPPEPFPLAEFCRGRKVVLVGLPGAFTPTWTWRQVPGYLDRQAALMAKGVTDVLVYCVNDGAVMDAWSWTSGCDGSMVTCLGDPRLELTEALGLVLDHAGPMSVFGGPRCKRFSMLIDNGIIMSINVAGTEEDPSGDVNPKISLAEKILMDL